MKDLSQVPLSYWRAYARLMALSTTLEERQAQRAREAIRVLACNQAESEAA